MRFYILQLLILTMQVMLTFQACAPDCAGKVTGDQVMDPTDCNRFYVCHEVDGDVIISETSFKCPQGQIFDETTSACAVISGASCGYLCNPCDAPDCNVEPPGTNHPNPSNCSKYYTCLVSGIRQTHNCPSGELYDYKQAMCVEENAVCYNFCDDCEPYCVAVGDFPDKTDCLYFYYCDPPYLVRFKCPPGMIFDAVTNECHENGFCLEVC